MGELPIIYVPEFLRSPVRIRRFWYIRIWDYPRALLRAIFRKKPKPSAIKDQINVADVEKLEQLAGGAE